MGQYYNVINVDKQQYFSPVSFKLGMKLKEFAYNRLKLENTLVYLLAHEWKGDRVYVVGDYTPTLKEFSETEKLNEIHDYDKTWYNTIKKVTEEVALDNLTNLYDIATNQYKDYVECTLEENKVSFNDIVKPNFKVVYNPIKNEYLDLDSASEDTEFNFSQLILLLTVNNNNGGGDFGNTNQLNLVGSWVDDVQSLQVFQSLEDFKEQVKENVKLFDTIFIDD